MKAVTLFQLWVPLVALLLNSSDAYCPVVICPGFGNDSIDYDEPLQQPQEVGLKSVLSRRGFDPDRIYTVPIQRSDWIRVAGGLLDIPNFYTGNALPTGLGYGWYIKRLKESVDQAYEESGGEKVILIAHSAGGWLARAAMSDGIWRDEEGTCIRTNERVRCLVTMGAIHRVPEDESTCVTRGALKNTDALFPGAYLKDDGIKYVSIGGAAVVGQKLDADSDAAGDKASRVAFSSYQAVSGQGGLTGDGVVPLSWTQLDGARQILLDDVFHSINEAGTTNPTDRWYGSEGVIDRWLPTVMEEVGIGNKQTKTKDNLFAFDGLGSWVSNLMSPPEDKSR